MKFLGGVSIGDDVLCPEVELRDDQDEGMDDPQLTQMATSSKKQNTVPLKIKTERLQDEVLHLQKEVLLLQKENEMIRNKVLMNILNKQSEESFINEIIEEVL